MKSALLLPRHFADYLNNVYFQDFDPKAKDIEVSRHSIGHGVASAEKFDRKSAVISILKSSPIVLPSRKRVEISSSQDVEEVDEDKVE